MTFKDPGNPFGTTYAIDPKQRLIIVGVEGSRTSIGVKAQFNPNTVQLDRSVPWQKVKNAKAAGDLEYTGAEARSMSFELMFDGFETNMSVQPEIEKLQLLCDPDDAINPKRPGKCIVVWGPVQFTCVIESLAVKYTMFSPEGWPVRGTANIKVKEANTLTIAKSK
jgi:hypothetical protein